MPLGVAIDARSAHDVVPGTVAVHVKVSGGAPPLTLTLFLDGEPVGCWESMGDVYEFRASELSGARHSLTVRAVDSSGRWGAATVIASGAGLEPALATSGPSAAPPTAPRFALRSSVKTNRR